MSATILPARAVVGTPIATNDTAHALLAADPTVPQFQTFTAPYPLPYVPAGQYQSVAQNSNTLNLNQSSSSTPITTGASATNAASGAEILVENTNEHWINSKWRPAMGWMYMTVCVFDFMIFPVLWSILQALSKGNVTTQWQPLTLQGAGLFHLAMGAVLGIAAYGRTKEKIENKFQ